MIKKIIYIGFVAMTLFGCEKDNSGNILLKRFIFKDTFNEYPGPNDWELTADFEANSGDTAFARIGDGQLELYTNPGFKGRDRETNASAYIELPEFNADQKVGVIYIKMIAEELSCFLYQGDESDYASFRFGLSNVRVSNSGYGNLLLNNDTLRIEVDLIDQRHAIFINDYDQEARKNRGDEISIRYYNNFPNHIQFRCGNYIAYGMAPRSRHIIINEIEIYYYE